ncbi:restriction endonuclease subunit S [Serratia ureilytica]|uniref:restriction endonuclease subunit S n=1 Tax=Serratia ureilytica TaxID=300181 RepID=UPI001F0558AE|nr:restriction endonuclease subunit S [Serratia ureilytica]UMK53216.1 restriction endonuclease subunit S [Serratia ureilytica]
MAKYKAYPEYKDSGVEWLGVIPAGWYITKLKFTASLLTAKSSCGDDKFVGLENISSGDGKYINKEESISEGASITFKKNDVLFGKLRPYLAKSWLATFSGVCSSEFLVLRTEKIHPRFLNYYSLTTNFIEQVNSSTYGSKMPRASWEFISLLPVPTCSFILSEKIALFLDHETAKIDKLIEKQQQLIELLKEKRQAVISHAVTKGLNPNVPMKDSKNTLLGKIPAHWGLTPMSFLADSITVGIVVTPAKYYKDSGVKCFRSLNVGENTIREQDWVYISEVSNNLLCKSKVYTGDILVVRSGQPGTATVVRDEFCGCNCIDLIIIRRSKRFDSNFICMQINSPFVKKQVGMASDGAIQLHFNVEVAKKLVLTEPPKEEQSEIFNFLSQKNKYFDELMKKSELQISLLQERRTALISAAVTGKIDVRDWVAPDMQDAEEPQETTV